MRCFIAIDIDPQIRQEIEGLQRRIATRAGLGGPDVKWVDKDAMHITLKFLGEVPDSEVMDLCRVAQEVASRHQRFDLVIGSVGHFGRPATVLWVGTGRGTEQLSALQEDLEDQLEKAGWPREGRRFTAHMTICRIKNPRLGRQLLEAYKPFMEMEIGTTSVDQLVVYHSQLRPEGPLYTPMGRYDLGL
ncbi:MAG: RNA 2',3'-cyclic phosphodiesterase [Sedimentisphaerales bacterium]|jgi:2'-5' RNA ligase|nr:RNA 2',3'-cyclic phosphodiesterase [Sedimentisphaerales bacterium]